MISAELAQITNCFLGDAVLADRVNGATRFHAIELHIDAPYLFYQPLNYRARDDARQPMIIAVGAMLETG